MFELLVPLNKNKEMGLNTSKGNMYEFITHTWNTVKGKCPHDCSYCYMKRWGDLNPVRFDEKELKTDLGRDNYIFVGSSCDMFANGISGNWVIDTIKHCQKYDNRYLFQSKNPYAFIGYGSFLAELEVSLCTTIETNRVYKDIMRNSPEPIERAYVMSKIPIESKFVTIEPIMDFDLISMIMLIKQCEPEQVNIGADSGNNNLPEPDKGKLLDLINALNSFTTIHSKKNLQRLLK